MSQHSNCRVFFTNRLKPSDSSAGEGDTHTLLPDSSVEKRNQYLVNFSAVIRNHLILFVVLTDVFTIIVLTSLFLTMNALTCDKSTKTEFLELCEPFEQTDKVIVDLNFGLLIHCDMPRSCVAYAQVLMEKQGFNYNFILGDEELVYVGKGYQCRSDTLRIQMLVTRYTWDPKQPIFKVPDEVVMRYAEVISEGLRCGKLAPNYTVSSTCSAYGEWCGASNIKDQIPWQSSPVAAVASSGPRRHFWFEPAYPRGHAFLAFDQNRVYEGQYQLKACNSKVKYH